MTGSSGIACVQFCLVSGTEFLKEGRPLSFPSMPSQAWGWTRDPTGGLFEKPKKKAQKGPMGLLVTSDPHSSLNVKCPLSEHETPHYLQPASVAAPKPCPHPDHYCPKGFYVSYLGPFPSSVTLKWIQKYVGTVYVPKAFSSARHTHSPSSTPHRLKNITRGPTTVPGKQ